MFSPNPDTVAVGAAVAAPARPRFLVSLTAWNTVAKSEKGNPN